MRGEVVRSPLDPAQVESRSCSDLLTVKDIAVDTSMSCAERMVLINRIMQKWDDSTAGNTGRFTAERIQDRRIRHGLHLS